MKRETRKIIEEVAKDYGIKVHLLFSSMRSPKILAPKYDIMRRLRGERYMSSTQIGQIFNVDHTSVLYALGRTKNGKGLRHGKVPPPDCEGTPA
jgi:chromosomal replication initiation ATPase DnaA